MKSMRLESRPRRGLGSCRPRRHLRLRGLLRQTLANDHRYRVRPGNGGIGEIDGDRRAHGKYAVLLGKDTDDVANDRPGHRLGDAGELGTLDEVETRTTLELR